jgi:hypothetical protein
MEENIPFHNFNHDYLVHISALQKGERDNLSVKAHEVWKYYK